MSTAITLEYPFEFEGQTIKTLSLRRPTVGDNLAVQKAVTSDAEREIRLLANLVSSCKKNYIKIYTPQKQGVMYGSTCTYD